jgi:putative FmdB family regulatory protein
MPTYEYVCDACGYGFERFQSITDKTMRKCPECGKRKLRRLIGAGGGIIFRGAGFYETDYRSDSYKAAAGQDRDSAASSAGSSSSKSSAKSKPSDSAKADSAAKPDSSKPASGKSSKKAS